MLIQLMRSNALNNIMFTSSIYFQLNHNIQAL